MNPDYKWYSKVYDVNSVENHLRSYNLETNSLSIVFIRDSAAGAKVLVTFRGKKKPMEED